MDHHSVRLPFMTLDLGILLALACAFVANLGFFYKYRGANSVGKVDVRHPLRSGRDLFSSRWFAIGMLVAAASWALHVAALALAPMSVVQVALAAGVVLIAVMADRMFGFKVGRRQWLGLWLTAAGLVMLGLTLPAMHGAHSHFSDPAMISFEAGLFGLGGLLIMGPRMGGPVEHHGMMLGAASGVLFGVSDTRSRRSPASSARTGPWPYCSAPGFWSPPSPLYSPSTHRHAVCRTGTRCRSSRSPAPPPT